MDHSETHTRILEAAIEVFLEKGFALATVRDICARAGANVAAVNYHFGSKDALHAAALERIMSECHDQFPMEEGFYPGQPPEESLERFILNILRLNYPDDPAMARRSDLFWMELANPSPALQPLVERFMRPIKDQLERIIRDIIGESDPETVRLCAGSIVGQIFFHSQNRQIISQLYPDKTYLPHDVARLGEHVFQFSLAGLRALRESSGGRP